MTLSDKQITGIVSKNSIAYVKAIFQCYSENETVVLLRDENDKRIELTGVSKVINPATEAGWFNEHIQFRNDDVLAQIAFTSGTEGEPKGVLLTHEALDDVTTRLNSIMEVDSSIKEYVGIPANFSFGLGRFRAVAAAGGMAYLPENGFDPLEIRDMLSAEQINAVSAVPSLWRVLLKNKQIFGDERYQLKWIEIGSQYMSRAEKEELVELFPKAKIAQHYGLTEASRSSFLRLDQTSGDALESVGRAYGKTEFKISETGRICIRGPHVAKTLLKSGEFVSNIDDDGWFHTSDLGVLDDGYLYYKGRADDLINCGGIKLSPDALEREVRELTGLKEGIAICAVPDELTGHAVLLAYRDDLELSASVLSSALSSVLKKFGINNKNVIKLLALVEFPVTSTNKVQRKELAKLYESSTDNELVTDSNTTFYHEMNSEEAEIARIWAEVLKLESVDPDSNFYDLGGDSLSAIGALVAMESKGVPKDISKGMLQGLTVREIAKKMSGVDSGSSFHTIRSDSIKNTMTISIVRGLMVIIVIFAHWHQGLLEKIFGNVEQFTAMAGPLLSMGTPGFAVIYGVGAGYSLYPLLERDPDRLKGIFRNTALLLGTGITILAFLKFWSMSVTSSKVLNFTDFTNSFYSVLTFYFFASLTLYYWFKLIRKSNYPIEFSLLLSIIFYLFHYYAVTHLIDLQTQGVAEFFKLVLTGKYAYFLMMSGALIGIVIGLLMNKIPLRVGTRLPYFYTGIAVLLLGMSIWTYVYNIDMWDHWPVRENYLWRWITYSGVIILLLVLVSFSLVTYDQSSKFKRYIMQMLSVTGVLAFPLFVLHEMVMPLKDILIAYGISNGLALLVPMLSFVLLSYLLYRKLHRISFQ
ncbi:AMP-binding protein [Methylophaga thalassica]|uniref:AMP-binding protein n=1 Tax=Methylophaga aminisulfidivorans TaxID=230105 RepID=UPI0024E1A9F1|nr:AMP-binding protein [Methylophaga aminisulfidivorans]